MIDMLPLIIVILNVVFVALWITENNFYMKYAWISIIGITWQFFIYYDQFRVIAQIGWGLIIIPFIFLLVDIVKNAWRQKQAKRMDY